MSNDSKKRMMTVGVIVVAVLSLASLAFILWPGSDKVIIEVTPTEPIQFDDWKLVVSEEGKLSLWTLADHLVVIDENDGSRLPLECADDVRKEIMEIERAKFHPPAPPGAVYLTVEPADMTLLGYASTRTNLHSAVQGLPKLDVKATAERGRTDLVIGFSRSSVKTTNKFLECVTSSGTSGHRYTWMDGMLVGALAVVGLHEVEAKAKGTAGTSGITVDITSIATRYVQYGKSKGLRLKEVLKHLKKGESDPAHAAEVFEAGIESHAVIGAHSYTHPM